MWRAYFQRQYLKTETIFLKIFITYFIAAFIIFKKCIFNSTTFYSHNSKLVARIEKIS